MYPVSDHIEKNSVVGITAYRAGVQKRSMSYEGVLMALLTLFFSFHVMAIKKIEQTKKIKSIYGTKESKCDLR